MPSHTNPVVSFVVGRTMISFNWYFSFYKLWSFFLLLLKTQIVYCCLKPKLCVPNCLPKLGVTTENMQKILLKLMLTYCIVDTGWYSLGSSGGWRSWSENAPVLLIWWYREHGQQNGIPRGTRKDTRQSYDIQVRTLPFGSYSQTCVKRPYTTRQIFGFSDRWLLIAVWN